MYMYVLMPITPIVKVYNYYFLNTKYGSITNFFIYSRENFFFYVLLSLSGVLCLREEWKSS